MPRAPSSSRDPGGAVTKERCRVWLIALAMGWRCLMTPVSFLQGKERYNFPNPNPFVEDDMDKNEIASVAYRYVSSLVPPPCVGWRRDMLPTPVFLGFPGGSAGKEAT